MSAFWLWSCLLFTGAHAADDPKLPNLVYTADRVGTLASPPFGGIEHYNQPSVVQGHLLLSGNGHFELWDIQNPFRPVQVSTFDSTYGVREAESHQVASTRTPDGDVYVVTISGKGVDLWDLTDVEQPELLSSVLLEGVNYGDNSEAVWGVAWQGNVVFAGGTNTGLHVIDVSDPRDPVVVTRLTVPELGGVSAGPLWALGNLLVITTPKEHAGIATLDISDPFAPALLDAELPPEKSYIGGFYGDSAFLLTPLRRYDVTSDPSNINLLGSAPTATVEYLSFSDGTAWLGALRPNPGAIQVDLANPNDAAMLTRIHGRKDDISEGFFTDDQFTVPVGNHLVLCDDEIDIGCVIAITHADPDAIPPEVLWTFPADGQGELPPSSRLALSFSDQLDLRTVDETSIVVREVGGDEVRGHWGLMHTVLTFTPETPWASDAVYEVEVVPGGVTDLGGNAVIHGVQLTFSTGEPVVPPTCAIAQVQPVEVGQEAALASLGTDGATARWALDDATLTGSAVRHAWDTPGRRAVTLTVTRDGVSRRCATTVIVHQPLTPAAPRAASSVIIVDGAVLTADADNHSVTALAVDDGAALWSTPVCDTPRTLAADDAGRIWVACQDDDRVVGLNAQTGAVVADLALRWGARPYGIVWSPHVRRLLVTQEGAGTLAVIEPSSGRILSFPLDPTAAMPPAVRGLAVGADGRTWVTRFLSGPDEGEVYVIAADFSGVERLSLAVDTTPDDHDKGRGVPNVLGTIALSPDGTRAIVPGKKDNTGRGLVRDGEPLTTQNTVRTVVATLDTLANAELPSLRFDLDDHEGVVAAVYSPLGDLVFLASRGTSRVDVLDSFSGVRVAAIQTHAWPEGLTLDGLGHLVVHEPLGTAVEVFDVTDLLAGEDPVARLVAEATVPEVDPLDPLVRLGKQIFHNAATREMSQDGYISCAGCHPDGGTDARTWDFTDRGEGLRDTIDLRGKSGTGHGPVHWTANFDEIQDFENDIRLHFGGSGLMSDADFEATSDPLGPRKSGRSERLDAMAAYVATFDHFPRSAHRNPDGTLTDAAQRGRRRLEELDCLTCHSGPTLTDSEAGTRHDVGTIDADAGQRLGGPLDGFDTPTLLGLHATAPYLHDGSAPTLEAALRIEGHGNAQDLDDAAMADVVALLLQLEGELPEVEAGCACSGSGSGPWWIGLVGLAAWRRRKV